MTNETIVRMYPRPDTKNMERALDLARADEREKWKGHLLNSVLTDAEFEEYTGSKRAKLQGADVWISWSNVHAYSEPEISVNKPIEIDGLGGNAYSNYAMIDACTCPDLIARLLGIKEGDIAKFKIVRIE